MNRLGCNIRGMGFFCGVEVPKMDAPTIYGDGRTPLFGLLRFGYAQQATRFILAVREFFIVAVDAMVNKTQVFNSVVRFSAVNVVNDSIRLYSIDNLPSKPMRIVKFPANPDDDVSILTCCSDGLARSFGAKKQTRGTLVLQSAKINLAHAVAPLLQWSEKWRLGVGSTGPLRHYRSLSHGQR
jgi:hypothetical protein